MSVVGQSLLCDMDHRCARDVAMIDDKGYIYCEQHGMWRRLTHRCRKLRPHEINRLKRGEQVRAY